MQIQRHIGAIGLKTLLIGTWKVLRDVLGRPPILFLISQFPHLRDGLFEFLGGRQLILEPRDLRFELFELGDLDVGGEVHLPELGVVVSVFVVFGEFCGNGWDSTLEVLLVLEDLVAALVLPHGLNESEQLGLGGD
jgi:hypothetical protein